MPVLPVVGTWFRRNVLPLASRHFWKEYAGLLILAVAAGWLAWRGDWTRAQGAALAGVWLVALALLLRRGWVRLFGPVLFFELLTAGRRRRYFVLRTGYVVLLLFALTWLYLVVVAESDSPFDDIGSGKVTQFAETFFYTFMILQFALVQLLAPAVTGGAIAEEKDRKTLEFLLATDLRNREIVLSKLLARLANMVLLLLAGLPILGFVQFLGGVDPDLVLAGFAATALTALSVASLGIFYSVSARKSRDAIVMTYLTVWAYYGLSALSLTLLNFPEVADAPLTWGATPVTVRDLLHGANAGNTFVAVFNLFEGVAGDTSVASLLPGVLGGYALFHGLVAAACTGAAVVRLRATYLKQTYDKPRKAARGRRWFHRPVGDHAMLWKELFAEPGLRLNLLGRLVLLLLTIASFFPAGLIIFLFLYEGLFRSGPLEFPWQQLNESMNIWVRGTGTPVACLLLLAVAVRASGAISGERDRQTLDTLLTTPLSSDQILFAKWLGAALSLRWGLVWLGLIWLLAVVTGGLHVLAVPVLATAWLVYALGFALVGLWYSMGSRTSLRATVWTLLTVLFLGGGHWLLWLCCFPVVLLGVDDGNFTEWLAQFQLWGLTTPCSFGILHLQGPELWEEHFFFSPFGWSLFALMGLAVWVFGGAALWFSAAARFRALTGRGPGRATPRYPPKGRDDPAAGP